MNPFGKMQTYDDIDRRRYAGQMLMQSGAQSGSPLGALASIFGGFVGRSADKRERQIASDEKAAAEERRRMFGEALKAPGMTEMDIAQAVLQFGDPSMQSKGVEMLVSAARPKAPNGIQATDFLTQYGDKFDGTPEQFVAMAEDGVFDARELATLKRKNDPKADLELEKIRAQIAKEQALTAKAGRAPQGQPTLSEAERLLAELPPELRQQAILGRFGVKNEAPPKATVDEAKANAAQMGAGSAENALAILDEGLNTGPFASLLPWKTSGDQRYMSEIGGIVSSLRALQRVKGSGAESDKELSLLLAQAPDLSTDEKAARDIIKRLQEKMNLYAGNAAPQSASGKTGDPLIDKYLD